MLRVLHKFFFLILFCAFIVLLIWGLKYPPFCTANLNTELYSQLSLNNGINTSRGYANDKDMNPQIARIIFSKILYPQIYILRWISLGCYK